MMQDENILIRALRTRRFGVPLQVGKRYGPLGCQ